MNRFVSFILSLFFLFSASGATFFQEDLKEMDLSLTEKTKTEILEKLYFEIEKSNPKVERLSPNVFRVYGFSEDTVLLFDGNNLDPYDYPCSSMHRQNDESNRWCHAGVVEFIYNSLKNAGFSNWLSISLASSVFIIKEHGYDDNVSKEDIVTPPILFFSSDRSFIQEVKGTFFLDGRVVIEFRF